MTKISSYLRRLTVAASLVAVTLCAGAAEKKNQDPDSVIARTEATILTDAILNRYIPWTNAEFNGKIRMSTGLPVTPTVKIYLERDNFIQVSLRAPFIGELARLDLAKDSVLIVNKYNRTYCKESTANLNSLYPGLISDIQSLLLGRIVILGSGELSLSNLSDVNFQDAGGDEWVVYPDKMPGNGKLNYGYVVSNTGRTKNLYAAIQGRPENVLLNYNYPGSGMAMDVAVNTGKRKVDLTLDFNSVKWGGQRMNPLNLSAYQKLGIHDFIRSVKI